DVDAAARSSVARQECELGARVFLKNSTTCSSAWQDIVDVSSPGPGLERILAALEYAGALLSDETRRRLLTESDASPREARALQEKERSQWPCRISSCSMSMSLRRAPRSTPVCSA